ncbi:MAG: ribosomal RNA small subunit methyltransferase A [Acidobacteria bacterium]|nr:ribosomal RNA small subunit methyltransferase A [Acidobacteriota bacterium]
MMKNRFRETKTDPESGTRRESGWAPSELRRASKATATKQPSSASSIGRRPRKRFGQYFLQPVWVEKLIDTIRPQPEDCFVEIGPGQGALTVPLSRRVRSLLAIEIDRDLAASLRARAPANVAVITADYLDINLRDALADAFRLKAEATKNGPVRAAGNLPYNVGSPILLKLLREADDGRLVSDATLMLQAEVAARLVAVPGTREYGVLSIFTQLRADVQRVLDLPPGAFRPMPKVRSAAVHLTFRAPAVATDARAFPLVVKTIFQQRRKTLLNAARPLATQAGVPAGAALAEAGIDPRRRPETLTLPELARLTDVLVSRGLGSRKSEV